MPFDFKGQNSSDAVSTPRILACCRVSVRGMDIFRLWIEHYTPTVTYLGALIVAEKDDDTGELEALCRKMDVYYKLFSARFSPGSSMSAMRGLIDQIEADWLVQVDSDEFLYEIKDLRGIVERMAGEGADYAVAWMADRLAFGGRLLGVEHLGSVAELEAAFPVRASITQDLARGCPYKVCLSRWPFTGAIHCPGRDLHKKSGKRLTLEHFKWREGLLERLQKRIRDHAESKLPWGIESERILVEMETHGRIRAERWLASRSSRIPGTADHEPIFHEAVLSAPEHAHFVQLDVEAGRSLCYLAEMALAAGKKIRIDAIDIKGRFKESDTTESSSGQSPRQHSTLENAAENLRDQGVLGYVNLLQFSSIAAASHYDSESLDFVWVGKQASLHFEEVFFREWWMKLKPGGLLAGHDQPEIQRILKGSGVIGMLTRENKTFALRKGKRHAAA